MLTFILTLPTPPVPFQVPSWCCALVPTSMCSEQRDRWAVCVLHWPCQGCRCSGADAMCGTAPLCLGHPAEGQDSAQAELVAPRRSLHMVWQWPRADEATYPVTSHLWIVGVLVPWEHSWDRTIMGVIALGLCHVLAGNYPDSPIPETNLLQERKGIISLPSVQLQWEIGFIFWK